MVRRSYPPLKPKDFQGITDPSLLRYVFTHADHHNHNLLATNDGSVTAVLDWTRSLLLIIHGGKIVLLRDKGSTLSSKR